MRVLMLDPEPYTALAIQWEFMREKHEVIGRVTPLREVVSLCRVHQPELALITVDEYAAAAPKQVLRQLTAAPGLQVVQVTTTPKLMKETRESANATILTVRMLSSADSVGVCSGLTGRFPGGPGQETRTLADKPRARVGLQLASDAHNDRTRRG